MLGLLGTVQGMVLSFQVIANSTTSPKPSELADGIATALFTTLEGLGSPEQLHAVQAAFVAEQAAQCGYCTNGMIMQSAAMLASNPSPSEQEIRQGLANNLCRCGTHLAVIRAIQSVSA